MAFGKTKAPSFAVVIGDHHPMSDGPDEEKNEPDTTGETPGDLEPAMEELIAALKSGDAKEAAEAFHSAFLICEAAPHSEAGESESEG